MDKATYQNKSLFGINVPEDKNPAWLGSLSAGGYGRKSKNLRWHMLNWKKETERTNSLEGRICLSKLTHGDLLPSAKLHNPNLSDQIALSTGHQLFMPETVRDISQPSPQGSSSYDRPQHDFLFVCLL